MSDNIRNIAVAFALENANKYGSADINVVLGRVVSVTKYSHAECLSLVVDVVNYVNLLDVDSRRNLTSSLHHILPPPPEKVRKELTLPNINGNIVVRFAPNPNGPLSFGHSRGVSILHYFWKKYGGKFILRFDDTDPTNKPALLDAYSWIVEDIEWLTGDKPSEIFIASDRQSIYVSHIFDCIKSGIAYSCTCEAETFKNFKRSGVECPHRYQIDTQSLTDLVDMDNGAFKPGECVIRIKTDMKHNNPSIRDWVAMRIVKNNHPRESIGLEHSYLYPTLDFQSAIDDYLLGITHIIRGKDLIASTLRQQYIYNALGWKYPNVAYWGKVQVMDFDKTSTSKTKEKIESGEISGWDDDSLTTLRSLKKKGFSGKNIYDFWLTQGLSERDVTINLNNIRK